LGASQFLLLTKHFSREKSKRMRWVGHVEQKTREKQKRDHFEDLGIDWRILKKTGWKGVEWINLGLDRYEQQPLAHMVNDLLDSIH
jgi:hypothetical protein